MDSKNYIIAYDLGTTGNKATMFDEQGNLVASSLSEYKTYYPGKNQVEQDPNDWFKAVKEATQDLMAKSSIDKKEVACLTFSGQMMGCVAVDKKAEPLYNALIWADQRGVKQAEKLINQLGKKEIYEIVGHRPSASYGAAKMMWLKENRPDVYKKSYKFLNAKDFIAAKMTGNFVTDYSDASSTNLFDLNRLEWSDELIKASGIEKAKMPKAVPSTEIAGRLKKNIANELNLVEGIPVVIGGGDGSCAAAGAGVVDKNSAYNYVGSSSWIGIASEEPLIDDKMRTFTWAHVVPGLYSPTGTMQAAGASYQWARDNLCEAEKLKAQKEDIDPYELMNSKASEVKPGADSLIYLPYLMGERAPHWNPQAKGGFIGLTIKHQHSHLVRAVMEGVSFNLRMILEAFLEQGAKLDEMIMIGGGAKGQLWRQIMADIYKKKILIPNYLDEATSMGAALTGGVGVGLYEGFDFVHEMLNIEKRVKPNEDNFKTYDELFELFKKSYNSLEDIFSDLHKL